MKNSSECENSKPEMCGRWKLPVTPVEGQDKYSAIDYQGSRLRPDAKFAMLVSQYST